MADLKLPEIPDVHHYIYDHLHHQQLVSPTGAAGAGAAPITLTSGAGAYNLGAFSGDIIAAAQVTVPFDIHWIVVANASANAWYEITLYWGAADTEAARIPFARTNVFVTSIALPVHTIVIPANSRVRAKMQDSVGASTADVKILYHTY